MIDVHFPVIEYSPQQTHRDWGRAHGEAFRGAISELIEIRTGLMREKNPLLNNANIDRLAEQQWAITQAFDRQISDELTGIAEGAGVSIQEIVILNNYTDFRDIQVTEQGCSAIYVSRNGQRVAGQTWDMHGTAKRYVCCLKIPADAGGPPRDEAIVFSVVGCVGMMGYSAKGRMVGVNNLNTVGARPGVLWPAVIRKLIHAPSLSAQRSILNQAPFTSGRCFLLAGADGAEFWEVSPEVREQVSGLSGDESGHLFHTNHCLGSLTSLQENKLALSSTTHARYELIERKIGSVYDLPTAWGLLNDHEGYPRSICSNYQTNSQDPSVTCGGAVGDLQTGVVRMWRGDPLYDANFIEHHFQLPPNA